MGGLDVTLILKAVVVYFVVRELYKWYVRISDRHLGAFKLASKTREYGLVRLPAILEAYACGKLVTAGRKVAQFEQLLEQGDDVVIKEFDSVFTRVLEQKLATKEGLAYMQAVVAQAAAPLAVAA